MRSTQRAYRTVRPSSQALRTRALMMWLLPVPGSPVITTSSQRGTKSSRASSSTRFLSSVGWKSQSNASRVLRSTRPLPRMRRSMRCSRLCAVSRPRTCSSKAVAPGRSRVAHSRRWSSSARVRVSPRNSRCRWSRSRTPWSSCWAVGLAVLLGVARLGMGSSPVVGRTQSGHAA